MDSAVEKFSAFDFLNLIIVGIVYLTSLGTCHYEQAGSVLLDLAGAIGNSVFLLCMAFLAFGSMSLVIGAFFQVIGHRILKEKLGWERTLIKSCLSNKDIFDNEVRFECIQSKARSYFNLSEGEKFTEKQSEAFFHHCLYHLQVMGKDYKVEKLFETQGLSELLVCSFVAVPVTSVLIYVAQTKCLCEIGMDLRFLAVLYVIYFVLALAFCYRYKLSCKNRVKMVLSMFEAAQ